MRRSPVALFAILNLALVCALPRAALANPTGLAGYSGKPNLGSPSGESCNSCHGGGVAPQIQVTGPDSLDAGKAGEFGFVVSTNAPIAAAGVAATDGAALAPIQNLRESFGELVPSGAVTVTGGQATFRFRATAPLAGKTMRLWVVGLAANNNDSNQGDLAAQVTKDVTIVGGAPLPAGGGNDPANTGTNGTANPAPANGGGGGASAGTGKSGASGGRAPGVADTGEEEASDPHGRLLRPGEDQPGCALARAKHGTSTAALTLSVALALALTQRRRLRPKPPISVASQRNQAPSTLSRWLPT